MSLVLDTSDSSDPGCDVAVGTGTRIVTTLFGAAAPPRLVAATVPGYVTATTSRFRNDDWVPVQFALIFGATRRAVVMSAVMPGLRNNSAAAQAVQRMADGSATPNRIDSVRVDGEEVLWTIPAQSAVVRDMALANVSLSRFYLVASARSSSGAAPVDGHAVAGVRIECLRTDTAKSWMRLGRAQFHLPAAADAAPCALAGAPAAAAAGTHAGPAGCSAALDRGRHQRRRLRARAGAHAGDPRPVHDCSTPLPAHTASSGAIASRRGGC